MLAEDAGRFGLSSRSDLREHLQVLLDDKEKQLQMAGTLGQRILSQQMELEERINLLSGQTDDQEEPDPETRSKLRDLAATLQSWDRENSDIFASLGVKERESDPTSQGNDFSITAGGEEVVRHGPSAVQSSRRAKNAAHRADDVEFAFEIGSGLLTEVRRLQSLLGERDKAIQDMKEEKEDLERSTDALRSSLQLQEQSADKFKEENWNLEVALQELRQQTNESQSLSQRAEAEAARLTKQLATSREAADRYKNEMEQLTVLLDEHKAKHDTDIAQMRKTVGSLQRDKSDLQSALENMKADAEKKSKVLKRFGSPSGRGTDHLLTDDDLVDGDDFPGSGGALAGMGSSEQHVLSGETSDEVLQDNSYQMSPQVNATADELQLLRQNYAHAQRQIATLRNSLQKEKEMRLDQKRKLVLAQSESNSEAEEDQSIEDASHISLPKDRSKARVRNAKGRVGVIKRQISLAHRLGMLTHEENISAEEHSVLGVDEHEEGSQSQPHQLLSSSTSTLRDGSVELDPAYTQALTTDSAADLPTHDRYAQAQIGYMPTRSSRTSSVVIAPAPLALELGFDPRGQDYSLARSYAAKHQDVGCQADQVRVRGAVMCESGTQTDHSPTETREVAVETDLTNVFSFASGSLEAVSQQRINGSIDQHASLLKLPSGDGRKQNASVLAARFAHDNISVHEDTTDTEAEWQDARESVITSTPSASTVDFHSLNSRADRLHDWSDNDEESIKTSRALRNERDNSTPVRVRHVREVASQTDLPEVATFKVDRELTGPASLPLQFVPPVAALPDSLSSQTTSALLGEISRLSVSRNETPIQNSPDGHENVHSEQPDLSKPPPTISLPPPPRLPPPTTKQERARETSIAFRSMPPPSEIPQRRTTIPHRPSSPPPRELIQRATTPIAVSGLKASQGGSVGEASLRNQTSKTSLKSTSNGGLTGLPGLSTLSRTPTDRRHASMVSLLSDAISSNPSRRSSISSDLHHSRPRDPFDQHPNQDHHLPSLPRSRAPSVEPTDPSVIHAITQTMIGEFLYKYTRRAIGKGHGEKRHKRYFWIHPYTKTLYWSSSDPGASNVAESNAKSAFIESVRSVLDPNPMPPGLYQYSVVVSTPQREMKITAPTKERHDMWLNALEFLLSRPNAGNPVSPAPKPPRGGVSSSTPVKSGTAEMLSSPRSTRTVGSSFGMESWNITPRAVQSQVQLSPAASLRKRAGTPAAEYLRWGAEGPGSPTRSLGGHGFEHVPRLGEEDVDFEIHDDFAEDEGFDGLENVRTCCNGAHIIGQHHQSDHLHHVADEPQHKHKETRRPASPSGWSFRSWSAGSQANEGGKFSWKKGQEIRPLVSSRH